VNIRNGWCGSPEPALLWDSVGWLSWRSQPSSTSGTGRDDHDDQGHKKGQHLEGLMKMPPRLTLS